MVRATLIRKLENVKDPGLRDVFISFLEETERIIGETVTRKEFLEFVKTTNENFERVWAAIGELAEAQKRTEERLNSLTQKVEELVEAQKRTEQRLNELAEAQKRTEERLDILTQKVEELAEAQMKTEQRLNELAEAQKKTEQRLNELAEAQKKTEESLKKLIADHRKTREHLGGLSHAFGYVLEDRAIKGLPDILKERFNIQITQPLKRDILRTPDGREIELNIFGKGRKNGKELTIIGECKSQLRMRDVNKFLNYVKMLDKYIPGEKFLILVAYQAPLNIREYIEEKGIHLVYSYELPLA